MNSNNLLKYRNLLRNFVDAINPVLALAGLLGLPLFAPLNTWFVYLFFGFLLLPLLARETKKIRYSIRSFRIQYHDDLEIKKKNNDNHIDKLTLTGIAIWNAGSQRFTGNDIKNNPLIIKLTNGEEIIAVDVLDSPNNNPPKIDNTKEPSELLISFDNLAPNQGASIQIIHTGNTNSTIDVVDNNGNKNLKEFDIEKVNYSQSRASLSFNQTFKIALGSAIFATLVSFLLVYRLYWDWEQAGNFLYWLRIIGFCSYTFCGNFACILWVAEFLLNTRIARIPEQFHNFHNQAS